VTESEFEEARREDEETGSGVSEDSPSGGVGGQGGEGADQAATTPAISVEGEHGQTQVPAPDDDKGGADDEPDRTD
jgi:hypothetical protein